MFLWGELELPSPILQSKFTRCGTDLLSRVIRQD
nr:MAG TPA: Sulfotransferase family [Caudoviricetes sp.]